MTTRDRIRGWLLQGKENGATHVIIMCDTFSWEDYPFCIYPRQDIQQELRLREEHSEQNMQKVMEVYDLALDIEMQLTEDRAWHL